MFFCSALIFPCFPGKIKETGLMPGIPTRERMVPQMEGKERSADEMPVGLMMSLAMHGGAMRNFALLSGEQQRAVIRFVEEAATGEDAKRRVDSAVERLENGDTGPFL